MYLDSQLFLFFCLAAAAALHESAEWLSKSALQVLSCFWQHCWLARLMKWTLEKYVTRPLFSFSTNQEIQLPAEKGSGSPWLPKIFQHFKFRFNTLQLGVTLVAIQLSINTVIPIAVFASLCETFTLGLCNWPDSDKCLKCGTLIWNNGRPAASPEQHFAALTKASPRSAPC